MPNVSPEVVVEALARSRERFGTESNGVRSSNLLSLMRLNLDFETGSTTGKFDSMSAVIEGAIWSSEGPLCAGANGNPNTGQAYEYNEMKGDKTP